MSPKIVSDSDEAFPSIKSKYSLKVALNKGAACLSRVASYFRETLQHYVDTGVLELKPAEEDTFIVWSENNTDERL